jgi:MFS family permease
MMSSTSVIGPVIVTTLALSSRPYLALDVVAALMLTGGIALALTSVSRNWIPEKKAKGQERLLKNRAMQMLMFEGCFIGFGWGVFDVAVPAFATQENVPHRVAWIFASFGVATVIGGLLGGLVSKKLAPLSALRRAYLLWSIACFPIAFTYPDWTMALVGASIGFLGGAVQVLGSEYALNTDIAGSFGFDAITVALLGRAQPLGTVFAALLFGALQAGGRTMQSNTGVPLDIVQVTQALIVLFIAAPAFVRYIFKIKKMNASAALTSKGWNG